MERGFDKPREGCGVFAVAGRSPSVAASQLAYLGLFALQHRGQESAGIAVSDGTTIRIHKGMGLVPEVFKGEDLSGLPGCLSAGHVRYSTTGGSRLENAQPILGTCRLGTIAVAHNGNLVNARSLSRALQEEGAILQSSSDSELFLHLLARSGRRDIESALIQSMQSVVGAYSLVVLSADRVIALRDPLGIRPLVVGEMEDAYIFASETCALDALNARFIRDLGPGEMACATREGLTISQAVPSGKQALCVFEFIYFARPDSIIEGSNVHIVRKRLGEALAREYPVDADMVIAAPDSGISAAIGFAEAAGIPYDTGLARNRYIGRTFIRPTQEMREMGVKIKLNPISDLVRDKRVVIVDDSIVRGTTSAKTVGMLRSAGARSVHMYIASPPIRFPCFYGIDTSDQGQLIAAQLDTGDIQRRIGADGLGYLSLDGLISAVGTSKGLCLACLTGEYPTELC